MSLSSKLIEYVYKHRNEDVRTLALSQKEIEGIDLKVALSAIQARQRLTHKWPEWANHPDVFIPASIMVEQASSPDTAWYKNRFVQHRDWRVLDLSGGMGADSYAFAEVAHAVHYLDISEERSAAAAHNFHALGISNIHCHTGKAESLGIELATQIQPNLIYIDPDRRPAASGRVFLLEESLPDITTLLPRLKEAAPHAHQLVKLSPMADIDYLTQRLDQHFDLHVISVRREAKELLLHFHPRASYTLTAVEIQRDRCYFASAPMGIKSETPTSEEIGDYLYDLFPAFSKIGYNALGLDFPVWKPALHTHFYFSKQYLPQFPGRHFRILESNLGEKKWLKRVTKSPIHLLAKNLPTSTDQLRKQLRVTEGGTDFLIAYGDQKAKRRFLLAQLIEP